MSLTKENIRTVALRTVAILRDNGFNCCLFGSTACAAWGMKKRIPNDVDVIVLTDHDKEDIKRKIVAADKNFYLIRSKNPSNTFQVLWCRVRPGISCKVDILIPGLLNIPQIPLHLIETRNDLPITPFLPLLLMKVQGWYDHVNDERIHVRLKVPEDFRDIDELLAMVKEDHRLDTNEWFPAEFVDCARMHVNAFVAEREDTRRYWKAIGFDV
ncbi:hypothetical protein AX15_001525 [Amanita polypyramis BW_CC]|nr:hypothetical protein AX15_001525 [Amanita polypyramis BW_CC]